MVDLSRDAQRAEDHEKQLNSHVERDVEILKEVDRRTVWTRKEVQEWLEREKFLDESIRTTKESSRMLIQMEVEAQAKLQDERKLTMELKSNLEKRLKQFEEKVQAEEENYMKIPQYVKMKGSEKRVELLKNQLSCVNLEINELKKRGRQDPTRTHNEEWKEFKGSCVKLAETWISKTRNNQAVAKASMEEENSNESLLLDRNDGGDGEQVIADRTCAPAFQLSLNQSKSGDINGKTLIETAVAEPVLPMDTTETADASPPSASAASLVSTFSSMATGEDVSCDSLLQSIRTDAPPPTPRTKRFQLKLGTDFLSSKKKTPPQPLLTPLSLAKAANKAGSVAEEERIVDNLEVAHKNQDKAPIAIQLQSPKLNIALPDETSNVKKSVFKLRLPSVFKSPKGQAAVGPIVPDEQVMMDMENSQMSEKVQLGENPYLKSMKVGHSDTFITKPTIHEPSNINAASVESLTKNRSEVEMSIPGSSLNERKVERSKTETTSGLIRSVKEPVPKARAMSLNSRVGTLNALKLSKPSKIQSNDITNGASHSLPVLASADLKNDENLRNNDESFSTKGADALIAKFPIRFTDLKFSKPAGPVGELCSVSNNDKVLHLDQEVNEDETEKKALEVDHSSSVSSIDPEPMKTIEKPKDLTSKCDSSVQGILNVEKENSKVGSSARKTAPFSNIPSVSNISHRQVLNVLPPAVAVQSQFQFHDGQAELKEKEAQVYFHAFSYIPVRLLVTCPN